MPRRKSHKTKKILINGKKSNVDINIIPIVEWINSFDGTITLNSCEGDDSIEYCKPYIQFKCENYFSLYEIIVALCVKYDENRGRILAFSEVSYNDTYGLTYCIRFNNVADRGTLIKIISK